MISIRLIPLLLLTLFFMCGTAPKVVPPYHSSEFLDYFKNYKKDFATMQGLGVDKNFWILYQIEYRSKKYPQDFVVDSLKQAMADVKLSGRYPIILSKNPEMSIAFDRRGFIEVTDSALEALSVNPYLLRLVLRHELAHVSTAIFNQRGYHDQEYFADLFACVYPGDDELFIEALKLLKANKDDTLDHPGWPSRLSNLKTTKARLDLF